jgi:hypothetical protein
MNHIELEYLAETPGALPTLLNKLEEEAGQSPEDVAAQAEANRIVDPLLAEIVPPAAEESDLALNQPVFHPTFGYGEVTAIDGNAVTFHEREDPAVTHTVVAQDLLTKDQAEFGLQTCWFAGGAKAWRRVQGKWASLTKNLCRHGEWADVLKKYDLNRSSMDVLIRRYEEEVTWEAQDAALATKLLNFSNLDPAAPSESSPSSVYAVTGGSQVHERTPDPENDERQKNIQAETSKREGIKPTRHKTILHLQRRNLDPEMLALYHAIKEDDKKRVDAIMQRKIDEGIEEVLALAPAPPPAQPETTPEPAAEEGQSAMSAITEEVPAKGAPQVNDAATDVRSALLNLGFKSADVKRVQFSPGLDFNEMMRLVLQQLKPATAEKKGDSCTV